MKKVQFEHLVIHDFEEAVFHLPVHGHTYYELIYIRTGSGIHLLNSNRLSYEPGDLFLICPEDQHHFEIGELTHFTFIKFTDYYFQGIAQSFKGDVYKALDPEGTMRNKLLKEVKLQMDEPYRSVLKRTIENIVEYDREEDVGKSPLIFYQLLSIFGLIREASAKMNIRTAIGQPGKEELITYIHHHIYEPEKLLISHIAVHFAISPSYFSDYFKNRFGIGYRSYVNAYKLHAIENRLAIEDISLGQIVREFGFTDESHLNKFFRTHKGTGPKAYRKTIL